jgi:hypothetical protein
VTTTEVRAFMVYCRPCKRKHRMVVSTCPNCRTYEVVRPASEAVYDRCRADYACDGCDAYRDHWS